MNQTDLDALQKHNWGEAFIKLKAYTASLRKYRYKGLLFPKGRTLEDFVQEAITSIFDENSTRNWDSDKQPDINKHLMDVISSMMSNIFTSSESKTTTNFSQNPSESTPSLSSYTASHSSSGLETGMDLQTLIEKIQSDLEEDEVGFCVFMERLDGSSNREIAPSLGIEIREVENAQKRINRVIKKYEKDFLL